MFQAVGVIYAMFWNFCLGNLLFFAVYDHEAKRKVIMMRSPTGSVAESEALPNEP